MTIMSAKAFFNQSIGKWESHRTYLYAKSGKTTVSVTEFEWHRDREDNSMFRVAWDNATLKSSGSMSIRVASDYILERDRGYFTQSKTESKIMSVNKDFLQTETIYDGCLYDERIEFVTKDLRVRRTIGWKLDAEGNKVSVVLIGNYIERRI